EETAESYGLGELGSSIFDLGGRGSIATPDEVLRTKFKEPRSPEEDLMDLLKNDEALKALLETGREKGYLTYGQVNEYLADDAVNPEKPDQLLMMLEEQGIELHDETEAE